MLEKNLASRAYKEQQKSYNFNDVGIIESNLVYFVFLLVNAIFVLILPILYGSLAKNTCIVLAVVFICLSVPFFIAGIKMSKKKKFFKFFYFIDFIFLAFSVQMSVLAIMTHFQANITFTQSFIILGLLAGLALLDLIILSIGRKERLLFSLVTIAFIALIFFAAVSQESALLKGAGHPLLAYSIVFLILHLSMLSYVFSSQGFYIIMSFAYLVVAIVALIIALMVAGGDGDCSCAGDCVPVPEGGRRGKGRRFTVGGVPPVIDPIVGFKN